jgi:rSAM/selenodomain-associated transferase 1
MAKASIPGHTKTRLIPALGAEQAAELNTAFLKDIADNLQTAAQLASISPWIAYAPAASEQFFRNTFPDKIGLIEAVRSNFGDCLIHALETLLNDGFGSACVLNSDSPTLPPAYLVTAATVLAAAGDRMVIGPSIDGGYYLLGVKQVHRRLFEDIEWSTKRVFEQTTERAREIGLPVVVLPVWYDIDEVETLDILRGELMEFRRFREVGDQPPDCRYTRGALTTIERRLVFLPGADPLSSRVA